MIMSLYGQLSNFLEESNSLLKLILDFLQLKLKKNPIIVSFEIPFFTVSGFRIQYIKIFEKSGYEAATWIYYLTQDGSYEFRT